jgi:hypothetical protein
MTVEKEFLEMMLQTASVAAQTGLDKYGKPTYSASPSVYRCRYIRSDRILRDSDGREIIESGRAILTTAAASVTTTHKLTLPDGRTPKIVDVSTLQDTGGNYYTAIGFGQ